VAHVEACAAKRLHCRGSKRFVLGHRRQNAGKSFREHGLAGTRGPDHQHAVTARCSNFERSLGLHLTFDFGEVRHFIFSRRRRLCRRPKRLAPGKVCADLQ
jgi:hypothetical protein